MLVRMQTNSGGGGGSSIDTTGIIYNAGQGTENIFQGGWTSTNSYIITYPALTGNTLTVNAGTPACGLIASNFAITQKILDNFTYVCVDFINTTTDGYAVFGLNNGTSTDTTSFNRGSTPFGTASGTKKIQLTSAMLGAFVACQCSNGRTITITKMYFE